MSVAPQSFPQGVSCRAAAAAWSTRAGLAITCALLLAACNREAAPAASQASSPVLPGPAELSSVYPGPPPPYKESLVLPGLFTPDTTPDSLRRTFSAANVKIDEGGRVILFPGDPTRRAYFYFEDEARLRNLTQIVINDPESQWRMDTGIKMGTTLADVVRLNGRPITYTSFGGWPDDGFVVELEGGALETQEGWPVGRNWQMKPRDGASAKDYSRESEVAVRSDDKMWPKQGDVLVVGELQVDFFCQAYKFDGCATAGDARCDSATFGPCRISWDRTKGRGQWRESELPGVHYRQTLDAGKTCTDSSQCEGQCMGPPRILHATSVCAATQEVIR
ncbi:hypothetical protein [Lysobacter terrae]